jgi:hypothetical protein
LGAVKSLLLGSAAGLVAVAGAQAADLPVKAKPVQYVKICSLYGVGFYYIPGTDMCIKVGGWVRAEYGSYMNGTFGSPNYGGDVNNRLTNNAVMRARGYITVDSRNQTEYGTVRGYLAVGVSGSDANGTPNNGAATGAVFDANRAFIQWAGFTFGVAQSFFDFYSAPATSYIPVPGSDTGDPGWRVWAYTAQFGNGFSGSISAEMRRATQIINANAFNTNGVATAPPASSGTASSLVGGANPVAGANTAAGYGGFQAPDIVANLRVDQAWGSAQIMGALHEVNAGYYTANFEPSGHPDDKWGWAIGAGFKLNAPFIGQGDYIQTQFNYTQGALRYIFQNSQFNWYEQQGSTAALGLMADGVYGGSNGATILSTTATGISLTTGWNVNAAYEHFWNPRWRTSLYGGYAAVSYGGQANALLCGQLGFGAAGVGATIGTGAVAAAGCDNNWNTWWLGSRTQWNVTKDFYMGLDVMYSKLDGMTTPNGVLPQGVNPATTTNCQATGAFRCFTSDADNWSFRFRVHRDFYP